MRGCCRADNGDGHHRGHPGEQVARRTAQIDDDTVALGDRAIGGLDRGDAVLPVQRHKFGADSHHATEVDTGRLQRCCRLGGIDAGEHVAGAHGVDLGSAGGEGDVVHVQLIDAVRCAHDDSGTVEDADHLVAIRSVEHQHVVAAGARSCGRRRATVATADDDMAGRTMPHCHLSVLLGTAGRWV